MCWDKNAEIEAAQISIERPITFFSSSSLIILKSNVRLRHGGSDIDIPTDPACLGLPSNTTSPAPPEGNGGSKNVEGGSEVPPGGLLDWEGERWTDDNGGEARAWELPQGDLHPATHWLRLSAPSWGLHRFGKVIPSKSPPSVPLPPLPSSPFSLLFLPLLTPKQEVMIWHEECERVRECYQHHYHSGSSLVQSTWFSNSSACDYWHILSQRIAVYILSKWNIVKPADFWRRI